MKYLGNYKHKYYIRYIHDGNTVSHQQLGHEETLGFKFVAEIAWCMTLPCL